VSVAWGLQAYWPFDPPKGEARATLWAAELAGPKLAPVSGYRQAAREYSKTA